MSATPTEAQFVLGIDAATPPSSVAIVGSNQLLAFTTGPFGRDTDAWILPAIDELLDDSGLRLADLARIGVSVGPGTFTGVRVGLATAMGLARGSGARVIGVLTLEAIALAAVPADRGRVLATIDARRGEIYAAIYDVADGRCQCMRDPWLGAPAEVAQVAAAAEVTLAAGTGLEHPDLGAWPSPPPAWPLAIGVASLAARATDIGLPAPFYLRDADARPAQPRRARRRDDAGPAADTL